MNIWQVNAQERGGEGLTRIEGLWEMGRGLPGACRGGCGLYKAEQQREVHDWAGLQAQLWVGGLESRDWGRRNLSHARPGPGSTLQGEGRAGAVWVFAKAPAPPQPSGPHAAESWSPHGAGPPVT